MFLATQKRRNDLRRFLSILIVTVLSAAGSTHSHGDDDLSKILNGAALESCAVLPTQRCVLNLAKEVTLKATESEMALYLAGIGAVQSSARFDDGVKTNIRSAKIEFARQAIESLAKVTAAQAKAGLRVDAETTIELVRRRLDEAPQKVRSDDDILSNLVEALARLGKFDEALGFTRGNDSAYASAGLLTTIAIHMAHARGVSQGLELLLPLPPFERHLAIRRFAWAIRYAALERGQEAILIEALRIVTKEERPLGSWTGIHHVSEFPPPLFILAQPLAETGRSDEAWRLALSVPKNPKQADDLAELAVLQIRSGGIAACLRTLFAVDEPLRGKILQQTLEGLVRRTRLTRVLGYGFDDGLPLRPGRVAATTAKDLAEALKVANTFPHDRERNFALGMVVAAQMQSAASSEAWNTARMIQDAAARYLTFRIIGRAEALARRETEARAAFAEAVASAKIVDCEARRQLCEPRHPLVSLASEMARTGFVKEALDVLEAMKPGWPDISTSAHYAIAQGYVKLGAIDDALAAGIPGKSDGGHGLGRYGIVAFELAKHGRIADAISMASQTPMRKRDTLLIIARELTAAGRYNQALQVIEAMEGAKEKVFALAAIGWSELHAGQHPNANEMFARALRAAQTECQASSCVERLLHIAASIDTEPVPIDYNDIDGILPLWEDFVGREYRPDEPPRDTY